MAFRNIFESFNLTFVRDKIFTMPLYVPICLCLLGSKIFYSPYISADEDYQQRIYEGAVLQLTKLHHPKTSPTLLGESSNSFNVSTTKVKLFVLEGAIKGM